MKRLLLVLFILVMMLLDISGTRMSLAPGLSPKNAFLYGILALLAAQFAFSRAPVRLELRSVQIPFFALMAYATLSWLLVSFAPVLPGYSLVPKLISLKTDLIDQYLAFLVFFYAISSVKDALWTLKYVLAIVVFGNIVTIIDAYDVPDLGLLTERADGRVNGPVGETNQFGAFLVFFLPAMVTACFYQVGLKRIIYILGFLASLGALVLTTSRGAFVGLLVGALLASFYLRRYVRFGQYVKSTFAAVILATAAFMAASYQYSELLYSRFLDSGGEQSLEEISMGRTGIWQRYLNKQTEAPITFVVGYGWDAAESFQSASVFDWAPHNVYLERLFTLGAIGLGIFLLLLLNIMRVTRKAIAMSEGEVRAQLIAFLFGFFALFVALFFVDLHSPWLYIWGYTGMMLRVATEVTARQNVRVVVREEPQAPVTIGGPIPK